MERAVSAITNWRVAPSTEHLVRQFSDPTFDDAEWTSIDVPSHWQLHDTLTDFDGTLLYRADLTVPSLLDGQRRWLVLDGICYSGDVFLDGVYLGATDGYFTHHRFEITDLADKAASHILAVEVAAPRTTTEGPNRDLTGWLTGAPTLPPDWNPAGIWRPVRLVDTGPVSIRHFRTSCIEATPASATVSLRAVVLATEPQTIELETSIGDQHTTETHQLAAGENRLEWQVEIQNPALWWPTGLGDQPLYDVEVKAIVHGGQTSDRKRRRMGMRSTSMQDLILRVNTRRVFARGINVAPFSLYLAGINVDQIRSELESIRATGFNLVRFRAHVTRPEAYDLCDELGLLVWQDLPLVGRYVRGVTSAAEAQAREMVDLLGHHASIVLWGAHERPHSNEPRSSAGPDIRNQQRPSWNRSVLDRSLERTLDRADGSRKVIPHSDVAPHIPKLSGSDLGLFFGWFDAEASDLAEFAASLPRFVRFVSDFGAQALPEEPGDLETILGVRGAERETLYRRLPPGDHSTSEAWAHATRAYQAKVLATTIETLRVLKYNPVGGFCVGLWRSVISGLSRSLLDADGTPRPAHDAAARVLQPVLPLVYPPRDAIPARTTTALDLYIVSEVLDGVEAQVDVAIDDASGQTTHRFQGRVSSDQSEFFGTVNVRGGRIGDVAQLTMTVTLSDEIHTNSYELRAE